MNNARRFAPLRQPGVALLHPHRRDSSRQATSLWSHVIVAACCSTVSAGELAAQAPWTERDSAGIVIVENHHPAWTEGTAWTVEPTPVLQIGAADGDSAYLLFNVRAVRLRDGRIAVRNRGTYEIRIFNEAGQHVSTIGGRGDGPGEFQSLDWVAELPGDSLVASDDRMRRVTVFAPDGSLARVVAVEAPEGLLRPAPTGVLADGTLLGSGLTQTSVQTSSPGINRRLERYYSIEPSGAVADILGDFPGPVDQDLDGIYLGLPNPEPAVGRTGFFIGRGLVFEIGYYNADGTLIRIARIDRTQRELTNEDRSRFIDAAIAEMDAVDISQRARDLWVQRYRSARFPQFLPAHDEIVPDANGGVWVAEYTPAFEESTDQWSVLDANGHLLGSVTMPPGFEIHQIGEDFVLGRWTDESGVEYVRMHTLTKR